MDRRQPMGMELLSNGRLNKSTAFTFEERKAFKLCGLLPAAIGNLKRQTERALENFRRKSSDFEKYVYLQALSDRNEILFYRLIIDNIQECMPIIYTPTVGQACQEFALIFRQTRRAAPRSC